MRKFLFLTVLGLLFSIGTHAQLSFEKKSIFDNGESLSTLQKETPLQSYFLLDEDNQESDFYRRRRRGGRGRGFDEGLFFHGNLGYKVTAGTMSSNTGSGFGFAAGVGYLIERFNFTGDLGFNFFGKGNNLLWVDYNYDKYSTIYIPLRIGGSYNWIHGDKFRLYTGIGFGLYFHSQKITTFESVDIFGDTLEAQTLADDSGINGGFWVQGGFIVMVTDDLGIGFCYTQNLFWSKTEEDFFGTGVPIETTEVFYYMDLNVSCIIPLGR